MTKLLVAKPTEDTMAATFINAQVEIPRQFNVILAGMKITDPLRINSCKEQLGRLLGLLSNGAQATQECCVQAAAAIIEETDPAQGKIPSRFQVFVLATFINQ